MAGSSLFFVKYRSYRWKMTTCFCISVDVFGVYTLFGLLSSVLYADCDKDYPDKIEFYPPVECIKDWENDYAALQESFIYGNKISFGQITAEIPKYRHNGQVESFCKIFYFLRA